MFNYTFSGLLHARAAVDLLHYTGRLKQEGSVGVNVCFLLYGIVLVPHSHGTL